MLLANPCGFGVGKGGRFIVLVSDGVVVKGIVNGTGVGTCGGISIWFEKYVFTVSQLFEVVFMLWIK